MQTPHATADPEAPSAAGTLSVLVVDDFRDGADSLTDLLRLFGHGVQTAYDPASALAADRPDVVVLELRLAGIDGWELVRRMRARDAGKRPLFIAVITCGTEGDRRRSAEAGSDLHLVKPVEPAVLTGEVRRLTRGSAG
jgi:DNA-binding response OmpR family regulator